ncbi:hypothetical protein BJP27_24135 (plasmid) [Pseudomonas oryzihabitans]|nr:hypothetical protein BJP27_24135 [Pseudomonas psychrotolerans]
MTPNTHARFKSLLDKGAWLLMLPAALLLFFIDPAMLLTILQWLLVGLVIAGMTIIVSRIMFPQVNMAWLVGEIAKGNAAAGLTAAALILFVGIIFLGLVLWAKA